MKTILIFPLSPLSSLGRPFYPERAQLEENGIRSKIHVCRDINHFVVEYTEDKIKDVGVIVLNLNRTNARGCLEALRGFSVPAALREVPVVGVYSLAPMSDKETDSWLKAGINLCLPVDRTNNPTAPTGRAYAAVISSLVGPQRLEGDATKKPSSASTPRP